jgi:LmbE family N-acetylglucosaminyl deacetylase
MSPWPDIRPDIVVVSPHLDDAALSCGAGIRRLSSAGRAVLVATVFTADREPDAALSPLARRNHASWGVGDLPFERRRAEDDAAMGVLGATPVHLGLPDAVYRTDALGRPLYDASVGVRVHPADLQRSLPLLIERLRPVLAPFPGARVFCPAGVGGHVDHLLARQAVELLCEPRRIVYYEEYPYLARPGAKTAEGEARAHASVVIPSRDELDARVTAVTCYRSQIRGLFPSAIERALEVLSAHTPLLGPLLQREPDERASARRAAERIARDVMLFGGERYSWADAEASDPFAERDAWAGEPGDLSAPDAGAR